MFCPAIKLLPFVAMKEGARVCDRAVNWWNDEPTKQGGGDHHRGRVYARLLLKAIDDSRPTKGNKGFGAPRFLEQIFEGMLEDAVRRRIKAGRRSRSTLTPTMDGFLREISLHICRVESHTSPAV